MDRMIILAGLLLVIIVGAINRRAGGILGVIFTSGLTYWGLSTIKSGGKLYILKYYLSKETFLIIMGFFLIYNLIMTLLPSKSSDN